MSQKGDVENSKVPNYNFSTKSVPDYCGFSNSAVSWGPKNHTNGGIPCFLCAGRVRTHQNFTFMAFFFKTQFESPNDLINVCKQLFG